MMFWLPVDFWKLFWKCGISCFSIFNYLINLFINIIDIQFTSTNLYRQTHKFEVTTLWKEEPLLCMSTKNYMLSLENWEFACWVWGTGSLHVEFGELGVYMLSLENWEFTCWVWGTGSLHVEFGELRVYMLSLGNWEFTCWVWGTESLHVEFGELRVYIQFPTLNM
jgi:hypothetical protein